MNLLLIIITIYYGILPLFFNTDKTKIYCGIFVFVGPKKMSNPVFSQVLAYFKLLGLYNDTRGGDNVGVLINGEVHKNKNFQEITFKKFAEKNHELFNFSDKEIVSTTLIGHSRKGSVGGKMLDDAHPFEILCENGDTLIGVHNGTISNWKELLAEYEIADKINNDSKAIYSIIAKTGTFDVFKKYIGAGTFVWTYKSNPQKVYIYKGKSKVSNYIVADITEEERPLFYVFDKKIKGHYFSSMKDSLELFYPTEEIKNLNHNTVFVIENGIGIAKESVEVDRSKSFQKYYEPVSTSRKTNIDEDIYTDWFGHGNYPKSNKKNHGHSNITINPKDLVATTSKALSNIYLEGSPITVVKEHIYRNRFKYYLNNMIANGIYLVNYKTGKVYHTYLTTVMFKNIQNDIKKEENAMFLFIYNGYLFATYENFKKFQVEIANLSKVYAPAALIEGYQKASKFLFHPAPFGSGDHIFYNGEKFTGKFKPGIFVDGPMKDRFDYTYDIVGGCITSSSTSGEHSAGTIVVKSLSNTYTVIDRSLNNARVKQMALYLEESGRSNGESGSTSELIIDTNATKPSTEDIVKDIIKDIITVVNQSEENVNVYGYSSDQEEYDEDEEENTVQIKKNRDLFLLTESEIVETINELREKVAIAKDYAEKSLMLSEWKKYISYELNSWIIDQIENALSHKDSAEEYSFDNGTKKFCFSLDEKDLF